MTTMGQPKPNGPAAAAILAAGIGVFVLGLMTTLAEASAALGNALTLVSSAGPLSGKVAVAVLADLVAWIVAGLAWRGRDVSFNRAFGITLLLIAGGFLLTFPPFFDLFAAKG